METSELRIICPCASACEVATARSLFCPVLRIWDDSDKLATNVRKTVELAKGDESATRQAETALIVSVIGGTVALVKYGANDEELILDFKFSGERFLIGRNAQGIPLKIRALTDAELCIIDASGVMNEAGYGEETRDCLLAMYDHELAAAEEIIFRLGRMSAVEKVCSFLADMARRLGENTPNGIRCFLPMNRNEIGDHLGLKTETVSRSISKLKEQRIVKFLTPSEVLIRDLEAVREMTGVDIAEVGRKRRERMTQEENRI